MMAQDKETKDAAAAEKAPKDKSSKEKPPKDKAAAQASGKPGKEGGGKGGGKPGGKAEGPKGKLPRVPKVKVNPRMRVRYHQDVVPALMKEFAFKNPMQVPRLKKIVLNMGLGEATQNVKVIDAAYAEMTAIAGQKPVITRARKSISTFKLRAGQPIGVMVTLRREGMWEFLDRLLSLAIPRTRDFKGISPKQFDGKGNFTMGVREQIIFPEIDYDKIDKVKGLNITFCTTARTDKEGRALLARLGMPFRTEGGK
jgi:large subunit ribosomal protein L5